MEIFRSLKNKIVGLLIDFLLGFSIISIITSCVILMKFFVDFLYGLGGGPTLSLIGLLIFSIVIGKYMKKG